MKNLVICIYAHPEAYPPTLNALHELSSCFDQVSVVYRPLLTSKWSYPANVSLFSPGRQMTEREQMQSSLPRKIFYFIRFTLLLLKVIRRTKPAVVLAYDNLALYSYHLLRPFTTHHPLLWYHNHDVVEEGSQRKYSIGWLALRYEKKAFSDLSVFSLPTPDRLAYFNLSDFRGRYFCIPNFPPRYRYERFQADQLLPEAVTLIFQGSMDNTHGLEELIPLLKSPAGGKQLRLLLLGKSAPGYQESLEALARVHGVEEHLLFKGLQPYGKIPETSASAHIGLAIYRKQDVMAATMGTASNKVFEYAAVGLPVICYDTPAYRKQMETHSWIFVTDCSAASYRKTIEEVISRYQEVSAAARHNFMNQLNFEAVFEPVKDYIQTVI